LALLLQRAQKIAQIPIRHFPSCLALILSLTRKSNTSRRMERTAPDSDKGDFSFPWCYGEHNYDSQPTQFYGISRFCAAGSLSSPQQTALWARPILARNRLATRRYRFRDSVANLCTLSSCIFTSLHCEFLHVNSERV